MREIFILVFIVWARFFGLFIVLPVLSAYLAGQSPLLIGLCVGAYALSQISFALPFGALSDKIGRKKTLIIGIGVFGAGSVICALFSSDIYLLILGRFIQGAGAIGAVASAFIADLVPDDKRSRYMAILGVGVGMAFALAMVLGPLLTGIFGLASLFWLCAFLCAFSLLLLFGVKEPIAHGKSEGKISSLGLIKNKNVFILCLGNFLQKGFLIAIFVALGIVLTSSFGFEKEQLWKVYALSSFFSFLAMGVSGALGDKRGKAKELFLSSVGLFALSFVLILASSSWLIFVAVAVFFVAFSLQEPILQSQMSKLSHANRGAALGLLNAFGYAGSFAGSMIGAQTGVIFWLLLALCPLWALLLWRLDRI